MAWLRHRKRFCCRRAPLHVRSGSYHLYPSAGVAFLYGSTEVWRMCDVVDGRWFRATTPYAALWRRPRHEWRPTATRAARTRVRILCCLSFWDRENADWGLAPRFVVSVRRWMRPRRKDGNAGATQARQGCRGADAIELWSSPPFVVCPYFVLFAAQPAIGGGAASYRWEHRLSGAAYGMPRSLGSPDCVTTTGRFSSNADAFATL